MGCKEYFIIDVILIFFFLVLFKDVEYIMYVVLQYYFGKQIFLDVYIFYFNVLNVIVIVKVGYIFVYFCCIFDSIS